MKIKTIMALMAVVALACLSGTAWADFTVETTGGIHEFELTLSRPGNTPRIMLGGPGVRVTGDPGACFAGGTYNIRLDPGSPYYKEVYAMLVAAYLMNKHFTIGVFSGSCLANSILMEQR